VGDVGHLAGAVDDQEQMVAPVDEHQVVEDAALVVQQQAVALLVHAQADHVHRHQRFERGGGVGADQLQLAHVRDVEQAGALARLLVLGDQAALVLHRHRIAGKGTMRAPSSTCRACSGVLSRSAVSDMRCLHERNVAQARWLASMPGCPLYLRDSCGRCRTCSFGGRPLAPPSLSSPVAPGCPGVCQSFA
jgi:hypothetical protein